MSEYTTTEQGVKHTCPFCGRLDRLRVSINPEPHIAVRYNIGGNWFYPCYCGHCDFRMMAFKERHGRAPEPLEMVYTTIGERFRGWCRRQWMRVPSIRIAKENKS